MSGWNTIVSDAGVFSELVWNLGAQNVQIDEIYTLDPAELRAQAPVHAVVFLFKYGQVDRESAAANTPLDGEYDAAYQDKNVFFARQTVNNACATQAVLNALFNVPSESATSGPTLGPDLDNLRSFVAGFDPDMCGDTIGASELVRTVHNSFTPPSFIDADESARPPVSDKDNGLFHFVTYLNIHNTIYELDGLRPYPIRHDRLASADDFYTKLPEVLQRRIAKYSGEIRFSLLAITNDKLAAAQEAGDSFAVQAELDKRERWRRENSWRRHDYTRLMVELLGGISKSSSDSEWKALLDTARAKTLERARR